MNKLACLVIVFSLFLFYFLLLQVVLWKRVWLSGRRGSCLKSGSNSGMDASAALSST